MKAPIVLIVGMVILNTYLAYDLGRFQVREAFNRYCLNSMTISQECMKEVGMTDSRYKPVRVDLKKEQEKY